MRMTFLRASRTAAAAACCLALAACTGGDAPPAGGVTVGLLLPFTGGSSATASNFERAVLYAADRINAGGGVHGRPVRVVSRDTHSDLARSRASVDALIAAGAVVVIGPESSEIAQEIAPTLAANHVALLSPLVGAANDAAVDCTTPWFRLAPSAQALGEALGKLASAESLRTAAVLYAAGAYDEALGAAAETRFTSLGGGVPLTLALDPNAQSYADAVRQTLAAGAGAIVLAASPRTGALVVNELNAESAQPLRWFLSPLLKTELLVENVAPRALEGALGVAPKVYDTTSAFPAAFDQRWQGDHPLEGAYFYYDAMGLLALALEKTPVAADGTLDYTMLQSAIRDAAAPPGEAVSWDELELGLERLRAGDDIYYSGLTGPMLLDPCGRRGLGATTTWQVAAGQITNR
jgi:ABC-type branched-subunit amino acid transport system substrate-binding protein